jgi:hypothetical protein
MGRICGPTKTMRRVGKKRKKTKDGKIREDKISMSGADFCAVCYVSQGG